MRNLSWLDIFSGKISSFSWLLTESQKQICPAVSAQQSQAKWNQENLHFFASFFAEICDKNGLVSASNGEFVPSRRTYSIWEIYVPWVWNIVSKCWSFAWARFNFAWRLEFVKDFGAVILRGHWRGWWVKKWKIQSFLYIVS